MIFLGYIKIRALNRNQARKNLADLNDYSHL